MGRADGRRFGWERHPRGCQRWGPDAAVSAEPTRSGCTTWRSGSIAVLELASELASEVGPLLERFDLLERQMSKAGNAHLRAAAYRNGHRGDAHDPVITAHCRGRREAGKNKMNALGHCMRMAQTRPYGI
jgi:hypothetical protein